MDIGTDKPKSDASDDLLGFKASAELTAKSIEKIQSSDGIVIGIEGQWGSGKTTYINFVRGELHKLDPSLNIIEFKPWLYSGRDELIGAYFRFLKESSKTVFEDKKAIRDAIGEVANFLTPAIKLGTNAITGGFGGDVAEGIAKNAISLLQTDTSLEAQYSKLWDALAEKKTHFVVVIDDLDRLEAHEIRAMLQLVKTVGQLPYLTYILSYDRGYVETCINEKLPKNHASYLEKIIQLQIPLPKPTQRKLLSMLDIKLNPFLSVIEDNKRWRTIADEGVIPYITKPRDIERILNAIKFTHHSVGDNIDIVDLIAMEIMRVFDNTLWLWVRNNKDYIFGKGAYFLRLDDKHKREDFKNAISELSPLREQQESILATLFPQLNSVFAHKRASISEPDYIIKNRDGIAIESVYDMYFAQQVFDDEVSKPILDFFLDPARSCKEMTAVLQSWISKTDAQGFSKITEFLEAVSYRYMDKTSAVPTPQLLDALWEVGDEVVSIDGPSRFLLRDPETQFGFTVEILLERLGEDEAFNYLKKKLNGPKYLSINSVVLHWIGLKIGAIPSETEDINSIISVRVWDDLAGKIKGPLERAFQDGSVGKFGNVIPAEFLAMKLLGDQDASKLLALAYEKSPDYVVKTVKSQLIRKGSSDIMSEYEFRNTKYPELFNYPLLAKHAKKALERVTDKESKKALEIFIEGVRVSTTAQVQPDVIN